ncbi:MULTISPECIES: DUF4062 domain-containing protein [Vibrio]|uniref:DUF4062 domain-containing protein n=1 Tax=Vibrio TaxID=662 RepID=UPI000AF162A2|nr:MULTISPECIES: DUF4062 domain-containing protein [Vibrio]
MNNVNKKYQVFVSSTYVDLVPERQEIMNTLLELDCIPAGMELFPAADEDQWSLIKGVIDECDYYIVVIGGRYGSLGPEGLSNTEMEYRYAIETEKPVIAFLHKEPDSIPAKFVEQTEEGKKKLKDFRELSQQKVCKYWSTPSELGSVVSRSLIMLQKNILVLVGFVVIKLLVQRLAQKYFVFDDVLKSLNLKLHRLKPKPQKVQKL